MAAPLDDVKLPSRRVSVQVVVSDATYTFDPIDGHWNIEFLDLMGRTCAVHYPTLEEAAQQMLEMVLKSAVFDAAGRRPEGR